MDTKELRETLEIREVLNRLGGTHTLLAQLCAYALGLLDRLDAAEALDASGGAGDVTLGELYALRNEVHELAKALGVQE